MSRGGAHPPSTQHSEAGSAGDGGAPTTPSPAQSGNSQGVRVSANGLRGDGLLHRRAAAVTAADVSVTSCFHHSDERHGLRAGGLGYPDAAKKIGNTESCRSVTPKRRPGRGTLVW